MKKLFYEKPLSEALYLRLESNLLAGSPGEPGSPLNPLEPINLAPEMTDSIAF